MADSALSPPPMLWWRHAGCRAGELAWTADSRLMQQLQWRL